MQRRSLTCGLLCAALLTGCDRGTDESTAPVREEIRDLSVDQAVVAAPVEQSAAEAEEPMVVAVTEPSGKPQEPEKRIRRSDDRPVHDDTATKNGIQRYESKRLVLYTDIPADKARPLPALVDQLYVQLEDYFGKLPPNREGSTLQLTGYVMADTDRFRDSGMLPEQLPTFQHGRNLGYEFWMNDQKNDYYRRHLLLHEATHCFMMCESGPNDTPATWYMEGMAELFATHRLQDDQLRTRVMPDNKVDFQGLGRITRIKQSVAAESQLSVAELVRLPGREFVKLDHYSFAWALCSLLDKHPVWSDGFRELSKIRTYAEFEARIQQQFEASRDDINSEWNLFVSNLDDGYDIARAATTFAHGNELQPDQPATCNVVADRGWQSSGVHLQAGTPVELRADGRVTLANDPKPWASTADGISIRYFGGNRLGRLMGIIRRDSNRRFGEPFPLGATSILKPGESGTLYLRINDRWNELADNTGEFAVSIQLPD